MNRKYLAESALNFYSSEPMLLSLSDVYKLKNDQFLNELIKNNNIYIICERRRITIDPHTIKHSPGQITGDLILHGEVHHQWERERFILTSFDFDERIQLFNKMGFTSMRPKLDITKIHVNKLGNVISFEDNEMGVFTLTSSQFISLIRPNLQGRENLKVLYIGQGIGTKYSRTAIERLKKHSTLQRILSDTMENSPTSEIIILLYRFENTKSIMSTASNNKIVDSVESSENELKHMISRREVSISRRNKINLVEAALINYFKPFYNYIHKDSFVPNNMRKLKILKGLFENDFSGLIVEINSSHIGAKLFSDQSIVNCKNQKNNLKIFEEKINDKNKEIQELCRMMLNVHIAKFPLYSEEERESFLHALPWKK